jgi:hypothetical protein
MVCPKCNNDSAHRSHRVGLREQISSLVGYHPYRCRQCKHRFLSLRDSATAPASSGNQSTEREIRATQSGFRWKRKKRDIMLYGSALILFVVLLYFLTRAPSFGN